MIVSPTLQSASNTSAVAYDPLAELDAWLTLSTSVPVVVINLVVVDGCDAIDTIAKYIPALSMVYVCAYDADVTLSAIVV